MIGVAIFVIPLLQVLGYVIFSNHGIKRGPWIMIISIIILQLLILPVTNIDPNPDGKEYCGPSTDMVRILGVIFSLLIHLMYVIIKWTRKNGRDTE